MGTWYVTGTHGPATPADILLWQQEHAILVVVVASLVSLGMAPDARLVMTTAALGMALALRTRT